MTTQYTPILQLALPVTGELNGTWGDVVNDNITSMVEEAIAGLATISTWVANSHTLTTADGTTDEARCAMLVATSTTAASEIICPARTKLFVLKNSSSYAVTLKTAAGTGVAVAAGETAFLFCDGTNVNACVTTIVNGHITGNLTVDGNATVNGNTTLGDSSADTVVINAGSTTINDGGAIRFEDNAGGEYVAIKAPATVTATYTLTLPIDDGTNGQALITDGSGNLSWSTAASGDVYGPASATDNAIARFDGTTGKLIQNSAVTIGDDGATVIAANSTSDGLRITQIGTGNALLVEDSANPDSSPVVIDADGNIFAGKTTSESIAGASAKLQITGTGADALQSISRFINSTSGPGLRLAKSRGATVGTNTVVQSGDNFGLIQFYGADGSGYISGAEIIAQVDGTPGTNDMPGRLVFSTTADGASSPTERMRIDSAGRVGIGSAPASNNRFVISGTQTLGVNPTYSLNQQTVQSDATSAATYFHSYVNTQAASYTTTNLYSFRATQGTIGAGSTVTNQYSFFAESTAVGATNNYGFYSAIASGTGRYNFYAGGTADNYFAGRTFFGAVDTSLSAGLINFTSPTAAFSAGIYQPVTISSSTTGNFSYNETLARTAAASFTLATLKHYVASQGTIGAGSSVTTQYGFEAASSLTGATNNYGFYSGIASGTGRWNFYAAGTAKNYFAGTVGIGVDPSANLHVSGTGPVNSNVQSTTANLYDGAYLNLTNTAVSTNYGQTSFQHVLLNASDTTDTALTIQQRTTGGNYVGTILIYSYKNQYLSLRTSDIERMRIDSNGNVGLGTAGSALSRLNVAGTFTQSSGNSQAIRVSGTVPSTATSSYYGVTHTLATTAAAFTLPAAGHFTADQGTIGAGSTVTNQYGYIAGSSLTGATNNYGFYSNIASGAGRYNFYAGGTADNYMAGALGIGTLPTAGTYKFVIAGNLTASTSVAAGIGATATSTVLSLFGARTALYTEAAAFTLSNMTHYYADQGTIGAGSSVTTQTGFNVPSTMTGATNNYGFYSNIASGTGRYNFYAAGTAANYFAGKVGIAYSAPDATASFFQAGFGSNAIAYGTLSTPVIPTTASTLANINHTWAQTASNSGTPYTLPVIRHYSTQQLAFNVDSTVSSQQGFYADSSLTGATNNYGFYSSIASGTGRYNFYASGTADNYFAGAVGIGALPSGGAKLLVTDGGSTMRFRDNGTSAELLIVAEAGGYSALYFGDASDEVRGGIAYSSSDDSLQIRGYNNTERMRIDSSGNVLVTGAGGLGYGTGSGGAVTQTTSRTTGVTLNKTNGAITLVSAAGSASYQSFTVTNSTVAATDTIIVNQKSGTDLYEIFVTAVAAGSFRITFATTGGTTTEQPVFNFAVIKAVTA